MMSGRKLSGLSVPGSASGLDRSRIGERLQAALAGLQELHHLRDKQSVRVHWALTLNGEESDTSKHDHVNTDELKLEATLSLLKQQLTRLRKQDMGLKNHLQQLDQQISELKLDVCKASTEHLESDSRPSSGFYELSDGGSGSLSNSCTSVYSESLSSSSQTNFPPFLSISYGPHGYSGSGQTTVSRSCSADESTTQSDVPRPLGVKLGSSCIRMMPASAERARQRPVSTGDLDRITTPGIGSFRSTDIKTSTLCGTLNKPSVDLKYQSNLVSSNGTEVYCYPSPLHAVALQSPIFSLTGDKGCQVVAEEQDGKLGLQEMTHNFNQGSLNLRSAGYINKLLQRSSSKINLLNDIKRNDPYASLKKTQEQRPRSQELTYGHPQLLGSLQQLTLLDTEKTSTTLNKDQQKINLESNSAHPAPSKELQENYNSLSSVITSAKTSAVSVNCFSEVSGHSFESSSMVSEERKSSTLRRDKDRNLRTDKDGTPQSEEFVHAEFVPAGSQRVKVRQGDKRTKSVKLKRKSSEKHGAKKPQQKLLSREKDFCKTRADVKQSSSCKGKMASSEEIHMYSSSDGSRNGLINLHCAPNKPHQTSKARKAHYPEPVHIPLDQPRKKQSSRKWPSASEIQLAPFHGQRSKEMLASRKTGMVRSITARPRSGQWGCPQRTLRQSLSTSSYLSYLESRYPPAPISGRNPPRCESEFSEYSAECASLFHSTIAASSDGEMSDYTTNRFGDSESSQGSQTASDSDSSLSLDEEEPLEEEEENEVGLVWAQAAMGPTAAGFSLQEQQRSESAACRIKASRALKKKIRRFQPASLKVMTLV